MENGVPASELTLSLRPGLLDVSRLSKLAVSTHPKQILGVVVEVGLDEGLDLLAAYSDYTARYWNHSGSGVVWERPDASLDAQVYALLAAGQEICNRLGPWDGELPGPPSAGEVRVNLLAPSGLYFGQGPFQALSQDPMGGPILAAATQLMKSLIEKTR